jgi:hypothetical protein
MTKEIVNLTSMKVVAPPESILFGLEDQFWLLFPLFNKCGFQRMNTKNLDHLLLIENVLNKNFDWTTVCQDFRKNWQLHQM